jgi:hypothetical protein
VTGPRGKEVIPVSRRDKAANTAQAARARPKRAAGKRPGIRTPGCGGGKKKASPAQAGEKLKDTANK